MLSLTHLAGFGAGGTAALDVTYIGSAQDAVNRSSYTFSAAGLGDAHVDRLVLVGYSATGGAGRSFSSATIGGAAATSYVTITNGTTQCCIAGFFALKVAAGTTADIVVAFSGAVSGCQIHVWRVITAQTVGNADYDTDSVAGTSSPSVSIDSTAGGAIFALCTTGTSTPATGIAFTEADIEDAETALSDGNNRNAAARRATGAAVTSQSMTAVLSGSPSNAVVAAVSIQG
jgi:hypothetical protein